MATVEPVTLAPVVVKVAFEALTPPQLEGINGRVG
jgi:hypothetical protein